MSFFYRLYDLAPPWMVIVAAGAMAAIVLLFGYDWLARRRDDREELARYEPVDAAVTDRRPADPPDVEPMAMATRFTAADHERAVEAVGKELRRRVVAKRPNRRKVASKSRRKK